MSYLDGVSGGTETQFLVKSRNSRVGILLVGENNKASTFGGAFWSPENLDSNDLTVMRKEIVEIGLGVGEWQLADEELHCGGVS
jgi:hypothetical protein